MPDELDHAVALERTKRPLPGAWTAQLRSIPPSSWHRDSTVPATGPPRAQRVKRGAEITCPTSPLPPGVRDQRGRDAQRRASRGPQGPAEARRLAERRGATRSEGPQGRPEIANTSSETCSCRDQSAKTQGGAGVLRRNESNRAEKYHKAKHRQKINCAAWNEPELRCKSVQVMQGNGVARPARPVRDKPVSARTRWNLFGDRGVVQGGPGPARRRDRLRSGGARRPRPSGPLGAGRAPSSNPSPATGRPGSPVPYKSVPRACRR